MSGLVDIIAERFDQKGMTKVEVPEWDVDLYFKPLTPAKRSEIRKGVPQGAEDFLVVKALASLALDKDGQPVFPEGAERVQALDTLMQKGEFELIQSIMQRAGGIDETASGDEVKNA